MAIGITEPLETRSHIVTALAAVAFPQFGRDAIGMWTYDVALAASLTPAQRAVATLIARHEQLVYNPYALLDRPHLARWLGLAPPGRLETMVDGVPLWFALRTDPALLGRFRIGERLELAAEIADGAYMLNGRLPDPWPAPDELTGEGVEWARRRADELAARDGRNGQLHLFLTLVRAKSALDPRWDRLAPLQLAWLETQLDAVRECIAAIPAARRSNAIARPSFQRIEVARAQLTPLQTKPLAPVENEYGVAGDAVAFYEIRDDKGAHKYDAVIAGGTDGGTQGFVYTLGTAKKVASFAQGGAEAKSVALALALEHALAAIR